MEIIPGIYSLSQKQGIFVHAFLLDDGDGLTLIDTLYSHDGAIIFDQLKQLNKKITELRQIVLARPPRSPWRLAELQKASGAQVYCHPWEADIVAGDRNPQCMSLKPTSPYRLWPYQIGSRFGRHHPALVDQLIGDGDRVGPLAVIGAPGHTPGHLVFYWPERRALFAGDALVSYPVLEAGWKAFTLNIRQNLATVRSLARLDLAVLGVGHGDPLTEKVPERLKDC
jgi:glyoxylase-like metal-dependent hydrolase (beta-lactamase superfamily II)